MIKKIKENLDTPWTNRTYLKWCGWTLVVYAIIIFVYKLECRIHRLRCSVVKSKGNEESRFSEVSEKDFRL